MENSSEAVYNVRKVSYPSTRCTQGAIRRDGHCVQEASVADVVGLQLTVGQVPHLGEMTGRLHHTYSRIKTTI